jgi:hypothetical protein
MFRALLLLASVVLFVIAALGAFGTLSGVNYSGMVAVGLACIAAGVLDFDTFTGRRRRR